MRGLAPVSSLKGLIANRLPFGIIPGKQKSPIFANNHSQSTLKPRIYSRLHQSEEETSASKNISYPGGSEQHLQPIVNFIPGELTLDSETAHEMADIRLKQSLVTM